LLRGAASALVDPATTAVWEMRLVRAVIDGIAGEAGNLITVLRQHNGGTVDLSQPARTKRGRFRAGRKSRAGGPPSANEATPNVRRRRRMKNASCQPIGNHGKDGRPYRARPATGRPTPSNQPKGRLCGAAC